MKRYVLFLFWFIYIIVCYNDNDMTAHHDGGDGLSSGEWVRTYVLLFIYLFILTCIIATCTTTRQHVMMEEKD